MAQLAARYQANWRTFLRWARPYRGHLTGALALALLAAAGGLSLPLVARLLIFRITDGGEVRTPIVLIIVLIAGSAAVGVLSWYVLHRTATTIMRDARAALASHLQRVTMPAVDRSQPGELPTQLNRDTTVMRGLVGHTLVGIGVNVPITITAVVIMAYLDASLLSITLAVAMVAAGILRILAPRIRKSSLAAHDAVGTGVTGADAARRVRTQVWSPLAESLTGVAYQVPPIVVLTVGGARVATSDIELGTLVAFLLYTVYLIGPLQSVVAAVAAYRVGVAGLTRIEKVLAYPVEADRGPARPGTDRSPVALEFRSVHFRYDDGEDVLRGLSFTAQAGRTTALVGLPESGTSTVFHLVERFCDHESGAIVVGGRDVRDWPLPDLRQAIGYVKQDAPVLAGTLRDNLRLGAPQVTDDEINQVLTRVRLREVVDRLPQGLDTVVGSRATALSSGERQRIAIARALLRRPRLLLLDEATAQLDAVDEAAFRDTIAEITGTTTVVVAARRRSTVVRADHVVVLDKGTARAAGSHAELADHDELYAQLWSEQDCHAAPALAGGGAE